eukprot:scaffold88416_cov54-Cyclotella_meneghiniana.AAC.1
MHELIDFYYIKLVMMSLFICGDLFINSTAEYEALNVTDDTTHSSYENTTSYDQMSQLQIILLGSRKKFRYMLIAQVWYSLMTIIVGAMRLVSDAICLDQVFKGNRDIWRNAFYVIMSFLHKLGAPCYYAISLRSALRLGDEKFYTKDAWISSGTVGTDLEA